MALIELGPLVRAISGSIGATTFARSTAGRGARRRTGPCNAGTQAELAARSVNTYVAKRWGQLSQTEQALWNAAGQVHPLPNRLGRYQPITGFALWMQLGTGLLAQGDSLITTPPSGYPCFPPLNPNVQATLTGSQTTDLTAAWNGGMGNPTGIQIKATGPTPWGTRPQREQLRVIQFVPWPAANPISLATTWSAVYGQLPTTTPYQILWEFTALQRPFGGTFGNPSPWVDFVQSTGGPNPTSPPAPGSSATSAPQIDESLTYEYTGSTTSPAWLALTTATNVTYTVVWTSGTITAAPILAGGPTPTALSTLATFAKNDAATFTARAGWTYYVGMAEWSAATAWSTLYAPSQVQAFPYAHLTGPDARTLLIAEAGNYRLISDVEYQGP